MCVEPRLTALLQGRRRWLVASVGGGLLAAAAGVGQAWLLVRAIDGAFLRGLDLAGITPWLVGAAGLAVVRAAGTWGGQAAATRLAGAVQAALREALSVHLGRLGPNHAADERAGELVTTLTEGVDRLEAYLRQYLPQLFLAVLVPLGLLVAVFPLDPLSGLVLLLTAPLIPLFAALIGRGAGQVAARQWQTLGRLSAHFLDLLRGLATLKELGRGQDQATAIARVSDAHRQATLQVLRLALLSALALELVATMGTAVVAVEVGLRLLYGRMEFAPALFVLLLAPELYLPLRQLGAHFHAGTEGLAAADRIFALLETRAVSGGNREPATAPERIVFDRVSFAYRPGRPVLQEVCLELRRGQTVALVGPSGSGKTTLAGLLLGFSAPTAGRVLIDGRPLTELDPRAWRRRVAWVPTRPHLFGGTLAANLRLARPEATTADLDEAARQAGLQALIESLPEGWETLIGEEGVCLSAGEGQRLALARAFLKEAPVLILDEPSAHLDPQTEEEVRAALVRLRPGRAVLLIAHRLTTVQEADLVVVLADGRVQEQGSPAALLAQGRWYRAMLAAYHREEAA
ncbi:MAG: thiol reductant ABC exporter subunit CydD [Candidatus Latescibacterota bacterium]|jgi:ATP-binding cassette subfamily C protein CydD